MFQLPLLGLLVISMILMFSTSDLLKRYFVASGTVSVLSAAASMQNTVEILQTPLQIATLSIILVTTILGYKAFENK